MTSAPPHVTKAESEGWALWEKIAEGRPEFGNPAAFNSSIPESCWESFTVTCSTPAFFDKMEAFSGNEAGTGGLVMAVYQHEVPVSMQQFKPMHEAVSPELSCRWSSGERCRAAQGAIVVSRGQSDLAPAERSQLQRLKKCPRPAVIGVAAEPLQNSPEDQIANENRFALQQTVERVRFRGNSPVEITDPN